MSKRLAILLLASCSVLLFAMLCAGCAQRTGSYKVASAASPNGNLEAVLIETNGGATTSFGYEVRVSPRGSKQSERVATLYGAVRNAQAYGVNLNWVNDHVLRIQYLRAKAIQNVIDTVNLNGQQLEVELQSGILDPSAPAGGMVYNLRSR